MDNSEEYIKVYEDEINNLYELMNIVQGKGDYEDLRKEYIFRGMDNIKYDLIPSSLRKNSEINNYIKKDFR